MNPFPRPTHSRANPPCAVHSRVVLLAYDGLYSFDFAIAAEIFGRKRPGVESWYELVIGLVDPPPVRGIGGVLIEGDPDPGLLDTADTIVVPGWRDIDDPPPEAVLDALRRAHARGARLLSICTGSFVLAMAGLLDGRRATTHWAWSEAMAERFPEIEVEPGLLYVEEGTLLTSAGSAAGIDLCLHVVRKDFGARIANMVARRMVVPPHRDGGQSQYIDHPLELDAKCSLASLLDWMRENLGAEHSVDSLARRACQTPRTFARRFKESVGISPHRWLVRERVLRCQELLETTDAGIDRIAEETGFGSAQGLRLHFRRQVGTTPTHYRKTFRRRDDGPAESARTGV